MRYRFIATTLAVSFAAFAAFTAPIAKAEDAPKDVKGLFLMSDYPAVTLRPGETSSISLKLQNYDLPPERLALSVSGVPAGWTATLMGGGQPVGAAMPATNAGVPLELRLDVPKNAAVGTRRSRSPLPADRPPLTLPIAVTLAKDLPAKLTLTPQLPQLRGTSKSSFEFQLAIKNDSGKKLHGEPCRPGAAEFRCHVHRAIRQPGAQRRPGRCRADQGRQAESRPPNTAAAGSYKVMARVGAEDAMATTELTWISPASRSSTSAAVMASCSTAVPRVRRNPCRSSSPIPALRLRTGGAQSDRRRAVGKSPSSRRRSSASLRTQQGSAGIDHTDREGYRR